MVAEVAVLRAAYNEEVSIFLKELSINGCHPFATAILLMLVFASATKAVDSIQVTVVGTLKTGILAIGGETTGSTITAGKVTWELDFGKDEKLRAAAEKLNGQAVKVTGTLEKRAGVEVNERWIVTVSSLTADKGKEHKTGLEARDFREGTTVTITGDDQQAIVDIRCERGIDSCTLVRAGKQAWPKSLLLRLHLRGLESLQATHGIEVLEWSVASGSERTSRSNYRIGNRRAELMPGDPRFSAATFKDNAGAGYFEVPIPAKFVESNPQSIKLQWIDFYR